MDIVAVYKTGEGSLCFGQICQLQKPWFTFEILAHWHRKDRCSGLGGSSPPTSLLWGSYNLKRERIESGLSMELFFSDPGPGPPQKMLSPWKVSSSKN